MKRFLVLVISVLTVFAFVGCSSNKSDNDKTKTNMNASQITKKVVEDAGIEEMVEAKSDNIQMMYPDLDASKAEEISAYYQGSGGIADEVAVIKVKSESDVKAVKAVFEARVDSRTKIFQGYAPDEAKKLGKSVIKTKGNYVFLAVCDDSSKAEKIFNDCFK